MVDALDKKRAKLMLGKTKDYANEDKLSNFKRVSEAARILRIDPRKSAASYARFMVLMKLDRWVNLDIKGVPPVNEGVEDTVIDLLNYTDLAWACDIENANAK